MAKVLPSSAIEKLERLVVDVCVPLRGAKEQVKDLRNDLRMALDSLKLSKILGEGSLHFHWMSQLLDMAHEADVAIDLFIFHLQSLTRQKGHHLINNIRIQIDAISEKIQHIQKHACPESYNLTDRILMWWGWTSTWSLCLGESYATCIVGMGGVGKTTLAKLLYNHQLVASDVSSEFNEEKILRELIRVVGVECEETGEIVAEHLRGTRYFIVLDNVWKDEDLLPFMTVFRHQDEASRFVPSGKMSEVFSNLAERFKEEEGRVTPIGELVPTEPAAQPLSTSTACQTQPLMSETTRIADDLEQKAEIEEKVESS